MGLYATLSASVHCPRCVRLVRGGWQFHFGDVSQVPYYEIGETVAWGGDDRGNPAMRDVIAVGYFDGADDFCARCGIEHALSNIHIVDHVILSIKFRSTEAWIAPTLFVGPHRTPY